MQFLNDTTTNKLIDSKLKEFDKLIEGRANELRGIDRADRESQLACTEYAGDIFTYLRARETAHDFANFAHRETVVEWLVDMQLKFGLADETLYLSAGILDRFLLTANPKRSQLPLIGLAALMIAAKYEEVRPPQLKQLVCNLEEVTLEDAHRTELEVLKALEFNVAVPSVVEFVGRYRKTLGCDEKRLRLAMYVCEGQLLSGLTSKYKASLIAISGLYLAERAIDKEFELEEMLVRELGYSKEEIKGCAKEMLGNMLVKERIMLSNIRRKYKKYSDVIKTPLDSIVIN